MFPVARNDDYQTLNDSSKLKDVVTEWHVDSVINIELEEMMLHRCRFLGNKFLSDQCTICIYCSLNFKQHTDQMSVAAWLRRHGGANDGCI